MHLVDVHAHLDHETLAKDLPSVVARAKASGVVAIITQGIDHEHNLALLELAKVDPIVKVAFGIYPLDAPNVRVLPAGEGTDDYQRTTRATFEETLHAIEEHKGSIIAVGEVGMDLKYSDDAATQRENLRAIVRLAKRIRKPLIIHSRKAEEEVISLLEEEEYARVVMHCFSGSKRLLLRGVALGLHFSIPAIVVRNAQYQQNAELVPVGQPHLETDAPWLSPHKGLRNEPCYIRDALLKVAEIKRMEPEELANALYFNYQKLFL